MLTLKLTSRSLIPDIDHHVKRMLKLIEEDADSFSKKVEIYYQKRPELINLVEDVHRMYRSLAERYDGELRRNIPSDIQSQCSGVTDLGSEPPSALPSPGPSRRQSGHRAAGFDFFLGNNGGFGSEFCNREGYVSSPVESESESDDSSVNCYSAINGSDVEQGLRRRIVELEGELREIKEKFKMQVEGSRTRSSDKIAKDNHVVVSDPATECGGEGLDSDRKILTLWEQHRLTKEKLRESEQEIARLKQERTIKGSPSQNLHDQLKMHKINLIERDKEIKILSEENEKLLAEIAQVKLNLGELQMNRDLLVAERGELVRELTSKDNRIDQMSSDLHQLHVERVDLIAGAEEARKSAEDLRSKIRELESKVEKTQEIVVQGAEEKREAIRQLCFSLEHYRNGYHRLRDVVGGGGRNVAA